MSRLFTEGYLQGYLQKVIYDREVYALKEHLHITYYTFSTFCVPLSGVRENLACFNVA